jgi:predicted membrane-bound spermidine synthase
VVRRQAPNGTELELHRTVAGRRVPKSTRRSRAQNFNWRHTMLMTLAIILIVLWLLGMVTAYTMGGLIHVLLVVAIIVILVRVIQGRNPI